jgi:predicted transcriptional regulator
MSDIYMFQEFVVRKNFFRGAQAIDERTLTSVGKGFVEYIENFERNLRLLHEFNPIPANEPARRLLYNTMRNMLLTKSSLASWAKDNVTQITEAYMNATPIFRYRYNGKTTEEHAVIPPSTVLYDAVTTGDAPRRLEEISMALDGAKRQYGALETILDDLYTKHVFNEKSFGIIRRRYITYIKRVNGLRSAVIEDVFRKPVDVITAKIAKFEQLYSRIHVLWHEMKQDLNVLNETVAEREIIWTAMLDVVNKSSEYLRDINIGKTALCKRITAMQLDQNINKFDGFFETLRSRSRTLKDAWNTTFQAIIDFVSDSLVDNDTYNYFISNQTSGDFLMSIEDLYTEEGFHNYTQSLREEISIKQQEGDLNALFGSKDIIFQAALRKYQDNCHVYLMGNRIDKNFYR